MWRAMDLFNGSFYMTLGIWVRWIRRTNLTYLILSRIFVVATRDLHRPDGQVAQMVFGFGSGLVAHAMFGFGSGLVAHVMFGFGSGLVAHAMFGFGSGLVAHVMFGFGSGR
jgi:hypothetical protein